MSQLPDIADFKAGNVRSMNQAADLLFEPCTLLHQLIAQLMDEGAEFESYKEFISLVRINLHHIQQTGDFENLDKILCAHPRLGAKKVESAQSQAEQSKLSQASDLETERLAELNAQYETTFPGLRYVVFVNGRPRSEIIEDMMERIGERNMQMERTRAIEAMCDIADDRAIKLQRPRKS